jgi:hypothetical protein
MIRTYLGNGVAIASPSRLRCGTLTNRALARTMQQLNTLVAGALYRDEVHGWPGRCGGRIGSVVASVLGGYLLSIGRPPTQIFLRACAIALVAAIATALRRTMEAASQPDLVPYIDGWCRPAGIRHREGGTVEGVDRPQSPARTAPAQRSSSATAGVQPARWDGSEMSG